MMDELVTRHDLEMSTTLIGRDVEASMASLRRDCSHHQTLMQRLCRRVLSVRFPPNRGCRRAAKRTSNAAGSAIRHLCFWPQDGASGEAAASGSAIQAFKSV